METVLTNVAHDIINLCQEITSEKLSVRTKAIEKLSSLLLSSKTEIIQVSSPRYNQNIQINWNELYSNSVDAIIKHAVKLEDSKATKSFQTQKKQIHTYSSVLNKIVTYSAENSNIKISSHTIYQGICRIWDEKSARFFCGNIIIQIIDTSFLSIPYNIGYLKFNEFADLFNKIFYYASQEYCSQTSFSAFRCIVKVIEVGLLHFQCNKCFIEYVPKMQLFLDKAKNDDRIVVFVIKINYLLLDALCVDYHYVVSNYFIQNFKVLCSFYKFQMKSECKEILFRIFLLFVNIHYLEIQKGITTCFLANNSPQLLHNFISSLFNIINVEINARNNCKDIPKEDELFEDLAAFVTVLSYENKIFEGLPECSTSKIQKRNSTFFEIISMIKEKCQENSLWFSISKNIIRIKFNEIEISDFQHIMELLETNALNNEHQNIKNIIIICEVLLKREKDIKKNQIPEQFFENLWNNFCNIVTEKILQVNGIAEKLLLWKLLIQKKKMNIENSMLILKNVLEFKGKDIECLQLTNEIIHVYGMQFLLRYISISDFFLFIYSNSYNSEKPSLNNTRLNLLSEISTVAVLNSYDNNTIKQKLKVTQNIENNNMINIEYKYLKRYILIDQSTNHNCKNTTERKVLKNFNLNKDNFEKLLNFFNLPQFNTEKDTNINLINTFIKIAELVYLNQVFIEFNILDTTDLFKKKIGLFINSGAIQLRTLDRKIITVEDITTILNIIMLFSKKILSSPIKNCIFTSEDIGNILKFVIEFTESNVLEKFLTSEECTEIDCIELLRIKILAIYATYFQNEYAFALIKIHINNINQQDEYSTKYLHLLRCFEYMTINGLPVTIDVANWILDNMKIICKKFHTNLEISTNIIDCLPQVFKSIIIHRKLLEDLFIIVSSFLKKCYIKNYNSEFNRKIIIFLKDISQLCPEMVLLDKEIREIYLSIPKFFGSSSLLIQFSVVEFIGALIDPNWLLTNCNITSDFSDFTNELYDKIKWNCLLKNTENSHEEDTFQNSTAVTVQLVWIFFCLSQNKSKLVFLKLAELCYSHNINRNNFLTLYQLPAYFKSSQLNLFGEIVESLIDLWFSLSYPLDKIPWYLCCENEYKFYKENSETIIFCALKYDTPTIILKVSAKINISKKELLSNAFEKMYSFLISQTIFRSAHNEPKKQYMSMKEILVDHAKIIETDFKFSEEHFFKSSQTVEKTKFLINFVKYFYDDEKYEEIIGFKLNIGPSTNELKFSTFIEVISKILHVNKQLFYVNNKIEILKLLNYLKDKIYNTVLLTYKELYLCKYIVITNFLLSSLVIAENISNIEIYFIKDIILFLLSTLEDFLNIFWISKAVVKSISNFFKSILNIKSLESTILMIIIKLKESAENTIIPEIKLDILTIIGDVSLKLIGIKPEFLKIIEPIIESDIFNGTNISLTISNITNNCNENIKNYIMNFVKFERHDANTIRKLTYNIFNKKSCFIELTHNEQFNQQYFKKLIYILTQKIKQGTEKEAIEASKCLGTIGPIYINKFAFLCCENEILYKRNCEISTEETYKQSVYEIIEKLLFRYDPQIYNHVFELCEIISELQMFKNISYNDFFILEPFQNENKLKSATVFILKKTLNFTKIVKDFIYFHEEFLKNITCYIYKNIDMPEFENNSQEFKKNIIEFLKYYFEEANNAINSTQSYKTIYCDSNTIKCILEITECLRIANDLKLPINLLHVANVATYQEANFLAVLYLEMWAMNQLEETNYEMSNEIIKRNKMFQKIASKAFKSIGCTEALSGFLDSISSRQEFLENSNNWLDILIELDITQSSQTSSLVLENLKRNGLFSLANSYCGNEIDYETCWRLAKWDIEEHPKKIASNTKIEESFINSHHEFEKKHFQALKAISEKDESNSVRIIETARKLINVHFKETSIECIQNLYKFLTKFKLLNQIEDFSHLQFSTREIKSSDLVLKNWESEKNIHYGDFCSKEQIFAQKIALLEMAGIRATRKLIEYYEEKDAIGNYLLFLIAACKNSTLHQNLTKRYLVKLRNRNDCPELQANSKLEDAINCWESEKKNMALDILQNLIQNKSVSILLPRIEAYRLYGQYCAETNREPFDEIYQKYFKKSLKMLDCVLVLEKGGKFKTSKTNLNEYCVDTRRKIFKTVAELADKEFVQISHHLNSPIFQTTIKLMNKNQQDAKELRASGSKNRDDAATWTILSKNSNIDESEINYFENKKNLYLCIAVENYFKFCKLDTSTITPAMYRITSMWLSNKSNEKLKELMTKYILDIPSYKFICVLTQLTAHLNSKNNDFIGVLQKIIVNCAIEHPHHTLSHIYSLINTYADEENSISKSSFDSRVQSAKKCLLQIKNNINCSTKVEEIEKVSLALIEFANVSIEIKKNICYKVSSNIAKLKNLNETHCLTEFLPIRPTKDYTDIKSIRKWDAKIELVGGVNAPKKLFCLCSDGEYRPQLLKGHDDMRQDAIMQQVLSFVDNLLKKNKDNLEQNLTIRTYKVVPLSKRSGILEWCKNTIPLGLYLKGNMKNGGAHVRYRPSDWTPNICRQKMQGSLNQDPANRLNVFIDICKNIHPVLHYFFFDKFRIPGIWFERRLSYINSVAASSIIGFILGLGDRHCQNILLDEETAEIVHIDFGIAFEQGKVMPTPETVPFRLTRDIIAPMGICEVNGVFEKSCVKTLKILQENSQVLITILEVLLYDPLYCWTTNKKIVSPNTTKNADEQEKNALAQRALIRVQSKLEGREENQVGSVSTETQVQKLIAEATNVHNLSRLYFGWEAYL